MRRSTSLLLLFCLVATGAAPIAGERLVCPMPMPSPAGGSCEACAMDSPAATSSLEATACCSLSPPTVAETVPATMSAPRRGGATSPYVPALASVIGCADVPSMYVPSLNSPAPVPAPSPPLLSTQTTHLRN